MAMAPAITAGEENDGRTVERYVFLRGTANCASPGVMRWRLASTALCLFLAAPAVAKADNNTHRVESGDSLWTIANEHGCSVEQLKKANGLERDLIVVGDELDVAVCKPGAIASPKGHPYKVKKGDTLTRIAQRNKTSITAIRRLNHLENDMIVVGQVLTIPGETPARKAVRTVVGQSKGLPWRGELAKPAQLPRAVHYYRRRTERIYAATHVVDHVRNVLQAVYDKHPKVHRLAIGDLSDKDGGPLSGHHSHQSGLDVDIGLYYRKKPSGYPKEFAPADAKNLDAKATFAMVRNFARTQHRKDGVSKIFLDYALQGVLYKYARKHGVSKRELREIFQYPDGKSAKHGVVRHERNHHDHIHVRFKCVPGDGGCREPG